MKRQWFAYFAIALLAELGTTWTQSRLHVLSDLAGGVSTDFEGSIIIYPSLGPFVLVRVIIWLFLYLVLTWASLLLRKFVHLAKREQANQG